MAFFRDRLFLSKCYAVSAKENKGKSYTVSAKENKGKSYAVRATQ